MFSYKVFTLNLLKLNIFAMNYSAYFSLLLAIAAGIILSTQLVFDTKLKVLFGGPAPVAVSVFGLAFLTSLIWAWLSGERIFPSLDSMNQTSWYHHLGGIARVLYLIFIVSAISNIGNAKTSCAAVTAQLIAAAMIEQFGLFGVPIHKLDLEKWLGITALIAGIYLFFKE